MGCDSVLPKISVSLFHLLKSQLSVSMDVHGVVAGALSLEPSGVVHLVEFGFLIYKTVIMFM